MKIRRIISHANQRDVTRITSGTTQLLLPKAVPIGAVEALQRRLRDRVTRPLAWKRRQEREELRLRVQQARGQVHRERPQKSSG
jgi:hypothetical protein